MKLDEAIWPNDHNISIASHEQEERYSEQLSKCQFQTTRYMDRPLLEKLGVIKGINYLFPKDRMVLLPFMIEPTIETLTIEFPSSITFYLKSEMSSNVELYIIFRLLGKEHIIFIDQFCKIFEFKDEGMEQIPHLWDPRPIWDRLTFPDKYDIKATRRSMIKNKELQYMHLLLSKHKRKGLGG